MIVTTIKEKVIIMFEVKTNRKLGELGIFSDISIDDYHAGEGVSSSKLDALINCPAKFFNIHKPSDATEFGTKFHCYFLEPDLFYKTYGVTYEPNGTTKAAKDEKKALEEQGFTEFVKEIELLGFEKMKEAIMQDELGNLIFNDQTRKSHFIEHSGYFQHNEVLCRFRPDVFFVSNDELFVIDLKTTTDCSPQKISYSLGEWNYHRQAAFYVDGMKNLTGFAHIHVIHFFVEKTMDGNSLWSKEQLQKNVIQAMPIGIEEVYLDQGRREYEQAITNYKRFFSQKVELPGYKQMAQLTQGEPLDIIEVGLPRYRQDDQTKLERMLYE